MEEKIIITTSDGVSVVGLYCQAKPARGAALLLHMMPALKESWGPFAAALNDRGISTLAIDLRGHGESVRKGDVRLDYHAFSDEEHQSSKLDVESAASWLVEKEEIDFKRLAVGGASIGANLAIGFAAADWEVPAVLALSPGLNYHGVTTDEELKKMREGQSVLLAASEEDTYSLSSIIELESMPTGATVAVRKLKGLGHGTTMFANDPEFMRQAADWLAEPRRT